MKKRLTALALVLVLCLSILCGCQGEIPASGDVALVIITSNRSNMAYPTTETLLRNTPLATLVAHSVTYTQDQNKQPYATATIGFILCDGKPEWVEPEQLQTDRGKSITLTHQGGTFQNAVATFNDLSTRIAQALTNGTLKADDPGSDLVTALSMARDFLNASGKSKRYILILDNGISTSGAIQMQNSFDLQKLTIDELLSPEMLPDDAIIDLTGIRVCFYGLGATDGEDQKCELETVKEKLVGFWAAYLKECNAIIPDSFPLRIASTQGTTPLRYTSDAGDGYPQVPIVHFVNPWTNGLDAYLRYTETALNFEPGKAEFINENEAEAIKTLKADKDYYRQILELDPNAIFYACGSIAMETKDSVKENGTLSLERAYKVAKLMIEHLGIPEENIRLIKAGLTELPWIVKPEFDENGIRIKDNSQANRVVVVLPDYFKENVDLLSGKNAEYPTNLLAEGYCYTMAEALKRINEK